MDCTGESENSTSTRWVIPSTEIQPSHSAILGCNHLAFYSIHYTAVITISVSLLSSVFVLVRIFLKLRSQPSHVNGRKQPQVLDFSVRFPSYLAIADFLWGISHLIDHVYLIVNETFPEDAATTTALSINLWLFLGYQQFMHAGLVAYMYLRVVHFYTLDLGTGDWRLHILCISFLGTFAVVFYFTHAFGCSGYWFLEAKDSTGGIVMSFTSAITCTANAICITLGFYLIKRRVEEQKQRLSGPPNLNLNVFHHHDTATQCLGTFIRNGIFLYCPFALLTWASAIQNLMGVVEPVTAFLMVVVANSSGWVNAWGYFRNECLKKANLKLKPKEEELHVHSQLLE